MPPTKCPLGSGVTTVPISKLFNTSGEHEFFFIQCMCTSYLSSSWPTAQLPLPSGVVGVQPNLAFLWGCLRALAGVVGDLIRGILLWGVRCCWWLLPDFQWIAVCKRVVVSSKLAESSCLMAAASSVMVVNRSRREMHRLQQKCGKPSPSRMTICAAVLKRSAIFASLPAAEKSALLLEGATAFTTGCATVSHKFRRKFLKQSHRANWFSSLACVRPRLHARATH